MSDKQVILGKLQTYGAYQNGEVHDEAIQIVSALYDAAALEFEKSQIMMNINPPPNAEGRRGYGGMPAL